MHGLRQIYHRLRNNFGHTLGDEAHVEARFSPFGDSANLDVDRCTVCAERTIGSEIILDAPDGTPT